MNTRDLSRFRTLRIFITVATLVGIDIIFFMTIEPWEGAGWLAQLGMLAFLNVAVGFAIYWLMDYASTPEIPGKVLNPVYIHPFRAEALRLACIEIGIRNPNDIVIGTGSSKEHNCKFLYVYEKHNKKNHSREYYYNKADTDISMPKKDIW